MQAFSAAHAADHAAWPLPPYVPELNPEKQPNGVITSRMADALPDSIAEPKAWACRGIRYLQRHPEFVANFFRHGGLHVTRQPE